MTSSSSATKRPASLKSLLRSLVDWGWRPPLWAVPFALFFGTLGGARPSDYLSAYQFSLVFSFCVGAALRGARLFIRRFYHCEPGEIQARPAWLTGPIYAFSSLSGAFAAAVIIHFTLEPRLLGNPQSIAATVLFTLLFCALFMGIN